MTPAYVFLGADDMSLTELWEELLAGKKVSTASPVVEGTDAYVEVFPGDPRDELEGLPEKFRERDLELGRIIALVDASVLEKRKELKTWFEMLTHFSDVLLLTNTKEVSPAWLTAMKKAFAKDRPMEIYDWPPKKNVEALKEEIIFPEARRLSQYFDIIPDADITLFEGDAEEDAEDAKEIADDEEAETKAPEEKYFSRDAAGRRFIKIIAP